MTDPDDDRWATASIRVTSRRLGPAALSRHFGMSPTRPPKTTVPPLVWLVGSTLDRSRPLEEHLDAILPHLQAIGRVGLPAECAIDVSIGYSVLSSQSGFIVGQALIEALAAVNGDLFVSLYASID